MAVRLRLGELLEERDLTQTKFAKMTGLSRNTISSLVNQPAQIRFDTIDAVCNTLKIKVGELFEHIVKG